jgi:hypothetical protein
MEDIRIEVHINEKVFTISCAEGNQPVRWLGDVAQLRYDNFNGPAMNTPKYLKLEDDSKLDMNAAIRSSLQDRQHVWVILDEDLDPVTKRSSSINF